jgi:alkanesulfonate monooxygenase SsuD/methylene tetrahydromethanopterin reductase-like flavin-dependent oxidoreductase (luciferase family)
VPVIIGAEGEKRGLRIAARHADIWQSFFGTGSDAVALFRHKDGVLRQHCADVGRDERGIERMIGCKLIIGATEEAARQEAEELVAVHKWPDPIWDVVWAGTSQQVADWLTPFVEAGAHSFAPQIGWPYSHETIERLVGEVKPIVDARVG